jgi:PAP2 superfamily
MLSARTIHSQSPAGPRSPDNQTILTTAAPSIPSSTKLSAAESRRSHALSVRQNSAVLQSQRPLPQYSNNGDERSFRSWAANFSKGLPHAQSGEVEPGTYETLLAGLNSGRSDTFQKLARGSGMRMVSPQAAFSVHLEGADAQTFLLAPPPSVASAEAAAEMVELYWQALARDVPFNKYKDSPVVDYACQSLSQLTRFKGPKRAQQVSAETIFRGTAPGDLIGPYLSQLLWKPIPIGSSKHEQKYRAPVAGNDFVETYSEWLQLQNGVPPWRDYRWETNLRHIITGRDLAEYIHYDFLYQAFLNAGLILMDPGPGSIYNTSYYFSDTNPYKDSKTVVGFVTLGFGQVVDWIGRVTTAALKAAWFQKWLVHRYLRPEEFGGLVHRNKVMGAGYPLHQEVMESGVLEEAKKRFGTYLLPQAYPEGCPLHPAYPSGHATVAGACATILKAFFDEDMVVPDCVVPTEDGQALVPYKGPALTAKAEIEKLAFNVAMGRNFAGIHWRSDAAGGIRLGEEVAITILEDLVNTFVEDFPGFQFTKFDGQPVHIQKTV